MHICLYICIGLYINIFTNIYTYAYSFLDPRNPTTTESGIHTFDQLNIFITNIALTEARTRLKNTNNREGILYLEENIDNLAQSQTLARLRGEIANPRYAFCINIYVHIYKYM
jgi:hypothetical protein